MRTPHGGAAARPWTGAAGRRRGPRAHAPREAVCPLREATRLGTLAEPAPRAAPLDRRAGWDGAGDRPGRMGPGARRAVGLSAGSAARAGSVDWVRTGELAARGLGWVRLRVRARSEGSEARAAGPGRRRAALQGRERRGRAPRWLAGQAPEERQQRAREPAERGWELRPVEARPWGLSWSGVPTAEGSGSARVPDLLGAARAPGKVAAWIEASEVLWGATGPLPVGASPLPVRAPPVRDGAGRPGGTRPGLGGPG